MKKTLKEELLRFHQLSTDKKNINENFIDDILGKIGLKRKVDDPKKADLISSNVDKFYSNLESIKNGSLTQQPKGSMQFQKGVETLQISLVLLGYKLPLHGVDGLFGPETQKAVDMFKNNNKLNIEDKSVSTEMVELIINQLKSKGITDQDIKPYIDTVTTGGKGFTDVDLSTDEGFNQYASFSQNVIDKYGPNPLGITGQMLAYGAKLAFENHGKYVPPQLALAQLKLEGGIGNDDLSSRPIRTKNPFNVGNVDSGASVNYNDVQNSINKYYDLIASNYIGQGKTSSDLVRNFVNKSGSRYASDPNYETKLNSLISNMTA